MKAPDMSTRDLMFWGGVIAGAAVSYPLLGNFEMPRLLQGVLAMGIGWVVGITAERAYAASAGPPKPRQEKETDTSFSDDA